MRELIKLNEHLFGRVVFTSSKNSGYGIQYKVAEADAYYARARVAEDRPGEPNFAITKTAQRNRGAVETVGPVLAFMQSFLLSLLHSEGLNIF